MRGSAIDGLGPSAAWHYASGVQTIARGIGHGRGAPYRAASRGFRAGAHRELRPERPAPRVGSRRTRWTLERSLGVARALAGCHDDDGMGVVARAARRDGG